MKLITKDPEETLKLGLLIGQRLCPGDIITLNGELGTGKTQLAKGIAEGLGINDYITSPTFTIVNEYTGRIPLYHFDVYRIEDIYEMYEIGFEEYLFGEGVCVIEWAEVIRELIPKGAIDIHIERTGDNERIIKIDDNGRFDFLNIKSM